MDVKIKALLSNNSAVLNPQDEGYTDSVTRWTNHALGPAALVVKPATEEDVAAIVKFAVENNVPFKARSGGHAWYKASKTIENGILIDMRLLNNVTVKDGQARIQGGATVKQVVEAAAASKHHART